MKRLFDFVFSALIVVLSYGLLTGGIMYASMWVLSKFDLVMPDNLIVPIWSIMFVIAAIVGTLVRYDTCYNGTAESLFISKRK
jgi:tryptophan-rich sensory protein